MINGIKKGTIVSTTEDRLTLLQWLKKLEKTLSDDTLADIAFTDDNGNVSLALTFEDGTTKNVAFPYDMRTFAAKEDLSEFAKKSDVNKPLEFKSKIALNDTTIFDLDSSDSTYDRYYLKVQLEDGIYPLDVSSVSTNKVTIINFGTSDGGSLNYNYLKIIDRYKADDTNAAFMPFEMYCNGLNESQCCVALTHEEQHNYVIVIDRGIITFTIAEEY